MGLHSSENNGLPKSSEFNSHFRTKPVGKAYRLNISFHPNNDSKLKELSVIQPHIKNLADQ